jgi:5-methylcytosine-specific restriction endonuclease McrA
MTLDHIIPITKGGNHIKDNVVPACGYCNSSKNNKLLEDWLAIKE